MTHKPISSVLETDASEEPVPLLSIAEHLFGSERFITTSPPKRLSSSSDVLSNEAYWMNASKDIYVGQHYDEMGCLWMLDI